MISAEHLRKDYPNLNPEVSLWLCTKESPMDPAIGPKATEMNMLIIHDETNELDESDTGRFVHYGCPHCGHNFWIDLGD